MNSWYIKTGSQILGMFNATILLTHTSVYTDDRLPRGQVISVVAGVVHNMGAVVAAVVGGAIILDRL